MDIIKQPVHYTIDHKKIKGQVTHVLEWAVRPLDGDRGYQLASALKYLLRASRKGEMITDLKKAKEHLDFLLEILEPRDKEKDRDPYSVL